MEKWIPPGIVEWLEVPGVRPLLILTGYAFVSVVLRRLLLRWLQGVAGDHEVRQAIIEPLVRPLTGVIALFGVEVACRASDLPPEVGAIVISVTRTLIIAIVGIAMLRGVVTGVERSSRRPDTTFITPATAPLYDIGAKVLIFGIVAWAILQAWDVDATAWVASAGILGVVIALAAQETLSNLFAGASILADAPYRIGHLIALPDGTRGTVTEIGLRSTRLATFDNIMIIIPNKEMASSRIVNVTEGDNTMERIGVPVQVAYSADLDQVTEVLLGLVTRLPADLFDQEVINATVRFRSFDDSGITVRLYCHVDPRVREAAGDAIIRAISKAFAEAGIEIPFPQRDVHISGGAFTAAAPEDG